MRVFRSLNNHSLTRGADLHHCATSPTSERCVDAVHATVQMLRYTCRTCASRRAATRNSVELGQWIHAMASIARFLKPFATAGCPQRKNYVQSHACYLGLSIALKQQTEPTIRRRVSARKAQTRTFSTTTALHRLDTSKVQLRSECFPWSPTESRALY